MQLIKSTIDQNTSSFRDVDGPLLTGEIIYLTARAMQFHKSSTLNNEIREHMHEMMNKQFSIDELYDIVSLLSKSHSDDGLLNNIQYLSGFSPLRDGSSSKEARAQTWLGGLETNPKEGIKTG